MQVRLKAIQCISFMLVIKTPPSPSSAYSSPNTDPTSVLRDPSNAPGVAFLFSALMKAAEGEMKAGLTGSKALSAAALRALRYLVEAVKDGDALAFVLPGLASGLAKTMVAAGDKLLVYFMSELAAVQLPPVPLVPLPLMALVSIW